MSKSKKLQAKIFCSIHTYGNISKKTVFSLLTKRGEICTCHRFASTHAVPAIIAISRATTSQKSHGASAYIARYAQKVRTLSATGSKQAPKRDTHPSRRAISPSNQSVVHATIYSSAAGTYAPLRTHPKITTPRISLRALSPLGSVASTRALMAFTDRFLSC